MKKYWKKALSILLSVLMIGQATSISTFAAELQPGYLHFDDSEISDYDSKEKLFLFGSKNMKVSEKSKDHYLMKIVRTGTGDKEADVTLKFTDISANYGENYTVSVYGDSTKPVEAEDRMSIVSFFLKNSDNQEEINTISQEELLSLVEESGGFETVNGDGEVISSVTINNSDTSDESTKTEGQAIDSSNLVSAQSITSDENDLINDKFPGTELTLNFAQGETEKYVVVTPKYSKKADGDCLIALTLKDPSDDYAVSEDAFTSYLTILDEDHGEDAVVSLEEKKYVAEGDSISVTVSRSGAINEMVSVNLCTVSETAEIGLDFQGIDATLYFPMGIESRTLEIPVNHTDEKEELTFSVKLVNPVNCTTDVNSALVSITPATEKQVSLTALGSSSSSYDNYLAQRLYPKDFTCFGNAWNTDEYWLKYSCKGVSYDTWNGGTYNFSNPYLYDGIRINWNAWHDGWGSTSYTYINTDNGHVYYSEDNEWDTKTDDVIFNKTYNKELWIGSLTSYFNGIQVNVRSVQPIYRTFNFNLVDADTLSFKGVDDATAKTYTATQFAGYIDTVKTVNTSVGGSFTVSAPKSQTEYARLVGLKFLDDEGNELYYMKNSSNTRSITVDVSESLLSTLACENLKYNKQSDGRYIGNITVKPVFEYIDAKVTVKSSNTGSFSGEFAVSDTDKTFNYHLGDKLTLSSVVSKAYEGKYVPDGVRFEKCDAQGNVIENGRGQTDYNKEGKLTFTVDTPDVSLTPTFRENDNGVCVQVLKSDVDGGKFDTDSGIFVLNKGKASSGKYYVYTVSSESVHLDQLVALSAVPASSKDVSVWTVPGAQYSYSGNTFYYTAARDKASNLITLSLSDAKYFNFTGYAFNADKNLSTGNSSATPIIPAEGALICISDKNTMADSDGSFAMDKVLGSASTCVRLMIYNNNSYTFKDVPLSDNTTDYDLGVVNAASNSTDGAYFTNIYCYQDDRLITSTETLGMNGKKLSLFATVQDGNQYIVNGAQRTETVTAVTFYVVDGTTHEIKSSFPAKKGEDGVWSAVINRFSPDDPDSYYYGDCFYVSMTTDRIRGEAIDEDGNTPEAFLSTNYAMLSTGYEIIKDLNYTPQKISINLPIGAEKTLLVSKDVATTESTKKSYASFPFIGAINTVVGVKGFINTSKNNISEGDGGGGSNYTRTQFRVDVSLEELPYGGTRLKIGMTAVAGNNAWYSSMGYNPFDTYKLKSGHKVTGEAGSKPRELISDNGQYDIKNMFKASFGSPRMTFSVSFGIYVDFGIIQSTDTETGATTGLTESDWVLLGIGGYLGGSFAVEFQWFTIIPVVSIPGYAGVVGTVSATGFLGGSKDPNEKLKYSDLEDEDGTLNLDKYNFNAEILADVSVKGYVGVGLPDVVGARIILGFDFSFAYSPYLKDYYTQLDNDWGLGIDFAVGGQIDLVVTRIPVSGFSVPLYSAGFTEYFVWLKRADELVNCTLKAIEEKGGSFSDDYLEKARKLADNLTNDIDNDASVEKLQSDFNTLLDYVYNDNVKLISTSERNLLYLVTPYGVWLNSSSGTDYDVIEHTDSKWLADRYMIENAAFQEATTQLLVKNSYSQPTSKLIDIGNNCLLSVFLMDTSEEGEVTNPTVVYTVYNTETEEWSEPIAVQQDGTVDYTPSVCDAGDKVLITWASTKKAYKDYLSDCNMMQDFDIYSICFDKNTQELMGEPEQLTDDEYMDCKPSAIYDAETGDIAVYYLKNSTKSADLADYITSESMVCYRLYDSESESWVIDYYEDEYPDYSAEERKEVAEKYKGQRFLSSAVGDDLPISDITVCEGYNGLGVYAYTVDLDGDSSTNADTELYLRVYDFRTHKTYKPIKITDDDVSQAMPQLIRNNVPYTDYYDNDKGEEVKGSTYLFWLEDDNQIKYISVTDLIRNGINDDGTLKEKGYTLNPVHINTEMSDGTESSVSSYQALTDDKNNLYIIWTQACKGKEDEDITKPAALEIYASAQIRTDSKGEAFNSIGGTGGSLGNAWSSPYQLTASGKCNDGVSGAVAENGKLYITHNRYSVTYIGDTEEFLAENHVDEDGYLTGNPYEISETNLMLTSFEPIGTVSATEFTLSDDTPCAGDTVTVTAKIENTGLTTASGYSLDFYEGKNGSYRRKLASFNETEGLIANGYDEVSFEWTVPEDFDGTNIICVAKEKNYDNETITSSDPIESKAVYRVNITDIKQQGDKFVAEYTVENIGNLSAPEGDVLEINFEGLYGAYDTFYGMETPLLASVEMNGLAAKSSKSFTTEFTVPESAFDYCGYDQASFTVKDSEGNNISDTVSDFIVLEKPISVSFTNGKSLNLNVGESVELGLDITSNFLRNRSKIIYSTDDTGIAKVDEKGNLIGVSAGKTTVTAYIAPFGTTVTLPVVFTEKGHSHEWEEQFTVDKEPTCTEEGSKSIHCKHCEATKDITVIPATGHSWDKGKVTKKATAKESGEKLYVCKVCGETRTETIPPKSSPKTGDNSRLWLWIVLLSVSGTALTASTIYRRKRKKPSC